LKNFKRTLFKKSFSVLAENDIQIVFRFKFTFVSKNKTIGLKKNLKPSLL